MATSAANLAIIIDELSTKFKFDKNKAFTYLANQERLPKKLLPKQNKDESIWASNKALKLAEEHGIKPEGPGSGRNGRWTMVDVKKAIEKPNNNKLLVSPNAMNLANERGISLVGKTGSGVDGRILLKDVEALIAKNIEEHKDELNISSRALQEAHTYEITDEQLRHINGSGREGRILLADIIKFHKSCDDDDDDDDDDDNQHTCSEQSDGSDSD